MRVDNGVSVSITSGTHASVGGIWSVHPWDPFSPSNSMLARSIRYISSHNHRDSESSRILENE